MEFVLILIWSLNGQPAMTSAEFDSKAACDKAGAESVKLLGANNTRFSCFPKK